MKFNFCPTCGEYLNLSYDAGEPDRRCPLGHSLQIPKKVIIASAIVSDHSNLLMERKTLFNKEFWSLPHVEVIANELPENTLSRTIQSVLSRKVSIESLVLASGDEQLFHLFYEARLIQTKAPVTTDLARPYEWFNWHSMPWDKIAYREHREILLQWLALLNDQKSANKNPKLISQYRGIKIL